MLRAGTPGATPKYRLIDQRDVESYDSLFALSDLFHEPPNFSPETVGRSRRPPKEFWG